MKEWFKTKLGILYQGHVLDVLKNLPDESVDCIITSPPYWNLRDYGVKRQIGLESTLEEYITKMLQVTFELKRILKKTGIMFWNHDTNMKNKCNTIQNWRLIIKMVDEQNWILRGKGPIIWYKINSTPSSIKDTFTHCYEPIFMLVKNEKYFFDLDAVRIKYNPDSLRESKRGKKNPKGSNRQGLDKWKLNPLGKNPGDVWPLAIEPFSAKKLGLENIEHFATFGERLIEPLIKVGCPQWICKKCGFIRERITKTEYKGDTPNIAKGKDKMAFQYERRKEAIHYTIGWTDCGCNAGWKSGTVLDPFMGSGTVAVVAERLKRKWIGIELNKDYCEIVKRRLKKAVPNLL
ncbi:site-specific DNA-methyltransferase [bacterium]|nr:site-specific DNA-methyltransferase [bacterium]